MHPVSAGLEGSNRDGRERRARALGRPALRDDGVLPADPHRHLDELSIEI
ncbi:hypothetical protein [Arthrobacter castelli]|nr:hypothetical protein [Arthrobacter castelli]